ncbi:ABC transporter permease [Rhodococcus sp. NPDC003348]
MSEATSEIGAPRLSISVTPTPPVVPQWLRRSIVPVVLLALWELAARTGLIDTRLLAAPSSVVTTAGELLASGDLQSNLATSVARALVGLTIGTVFGVGAALLSGLWRTGEDLLDTTLQMLRPLPALALIPLFILWFGVDEAPKLILIAYATFFPVYLNTFKGIRSIDAKLVEAAAVLGLNRWELIRQVVTPSALPSFFTGFRFSLSVSWLVLVVTEQLNARSGLGFMMTEAQQYFRNDIIVLGLVIYGFLGLASDQLVSLIERRVLRWQRTFAGA